MELDTEWLGEILLKDGHRTYMFARSLDILIKGLEEFRGNIDRIEIIQSPITKEEALP